MRDDDHDWSGDAAVLIGYVRWLGTVEHKHKADRRQREGWISDGEGMARDGQELGSLD